MKTKTIMKVLRMIKVFKRKKATPKPKKNTIKSAVKSYWESIKSYLNRQM